MKQGQCGKLWLILQIEPHLLFVIGENLVKQSVKVPLSNFGEGDLGGGVAEKITLIRVEP